MRRKAYFSTNQFVLEDWKNPNFVLANDDAGYQICSHD